MGGRRPGSPTGNATGTPRTRRVRDAGINVRVDKVAIFARPERDTAGAAAPTGGVVVSAGEGTGSVGGMAVASGVTGVSEGGSAVTVGGMAVKLGDGIVVRVGGSCVGGAAVAGMAVVAAGVRVGGKKGTQR